MSTLGLGTAAIGRPMYINIRDSQPEPGFSMAAFKKKALDVLEAAYQKGVRFYDTAPGYGLAESVLIDWLKEKNDPGIKVSTKWGIRYLADFDPEAKVHEHKEHSIERLDNQWTVSKKLLPYLDIYQIHSATFESGVLDNREILSRLYDLKQQYHIKIGLSTTGVEQVEVLKKAFDIEVNQVALFDSFQSTFNLLDQSVSAIQSALKERQFIIKEALGNGRLMPKYLSAHYREANDYLKKMKDKYGVGQDAIALGFCMQSFPRSICLSGANNTEQLMANAKACLVEFNQEEMEQLRRFSIPVDRYWSQRKLLPWN